MRKCEKCGTVMRADLRLKVNGGGYGIVVDVDEKQKTTTIDDVKVISFPALSMTLQQKLPTPLFRCFRSCRARL